MKKSKLLIFLLAAVTSVTIASGLTLTGCAPSDDGTTEEQDHQHSWSSAWSSDENGHWHACNDSTCEVRNEEAEHDDGEWVTVTPATQTTDGLEELRCTVCGYVLDSRVIEATGGEEETTYTVTFNTNGGSAIAPVEVDEGDTISAPAEPTLDGHTFNGWYTDEDCTVAFNFSTPITGDITLYADWTENAVTPPVTQYTVTFETNNGSAIEPVKVDEGGKVTKPTDPTNGTYIFGGWYSDALLENEFDFENTTVNGNITLYAKWQENVITSVDFMDLCTSFGGVGSGNESIPSNYNYLNIFTFEGGRTENGNLINTQTNAVTITLTGETNSITIVGTSASSGSSSRTLVNASGDVLYNTQTMTGSGVAYTCTLTNLPAGTYTFDGSGSVRITQLSVTQLLNVSTPDELVAGSVSAPGTDILVGQQYNPVGVTAQIKYENGLTQVKSITEIDTSEVNENAAGTYTVNFKYTENGVELTGSYTVNVYAIDSITIGDYTQSGEVTTNLKKVYLDDETLSVAGLTVIATAKTGTGADALSEEFILPTSYYSVKKNVEGTACDIAVNETYLLDTAKPATTSYTIYGINSADVLNAVNANGILEITVDANAEVSATSYKTLTDALCAIDGAGVPDYVIKDISVVSGTYTEKVYVNIPNVHLSAATPLADGTELSNTQDTNVVFIYNALAGLGDPSGNAHGTNGSGSFIVDEGATGFRAEGITFKNYYNTNELYIQSQGMTGDTQAVALYVAAEQAAFYNCKMSSYHDTLYAISGSHYFDACWIEGRTDFIFGNSATSYYHDCDIWVIGADSATNGGYVCAAQNNDQNGVFVFDGCNFMGDDHVIAGTVALGRPWGQNMKMVVMNSTISDKFSTAQHTPGVGQGERYVTMSTNDPIPANFIEYNNTGAGALVDLTEEEIAAYATTTCTVATDASAVAQYTAEALFTDWDPTVKDLVTVTVASNDGETIYGTYSIFAGLTPSQAVISNFIPDSAIPEGSMLFGFSTIQGATEADEELGAVSSNVVYYAVIDEIPEGALVTVEDVALDSTYASRLDSTPISSDYITISSTGGGNELVQPTSAYTSEDGKQFTYAYRPTGNGRSLTITAGDAACTVTIYYTMTDGSWAATNGNGVTWVYSSGKTDLLNNTTGTTNYAVGTAYTLTFELGIGESVTISQISNRRLTLFGYMVQAVVV